jgi:hypothetical protein
LASGVRIPSFIKVGPGIQILMRGDGELTDAQTHRQHEGSVSILSFFKTRKTGQKLIRMY